MTRLGRTPDELVSTWATGSLPTYAACVPGLNVLAGETLALVGEGASELLGSLADVLAECVHVDGAVAAAGGTLRVQAYQAARVGVRALAISEPFAGATPAMRALAVADLAGLAAMGLTTVVVVGDVTLAALVADRVVVVGQGRPQVAYPVLAQAPRSVAAVGPVTDRVSARLAAIA